MKIRYNDKEDKELWQLVQAADDTRAFAELHLRYAAQLHALAFRKLGDGPVAEDVVQDLFVGFWVNRGSIHIERTFNSYLFSSLKNRIISYLRTQITKTSKPLDALEPSEYGAYSSDQVQEWIHAAELQEIYLIELDALPPKSRQVFELSRSGLSNREIAGLLSLAEKTVEFHVSKCLRVLRHKMKYIVGMLIILFV